MQIPPFWIFYANIEFVFHSIQSKSQSTQSFVLLDDPWTLPLQISKFTYFIVFSSFVPSFLPSSLQSYFCLSRSSGRRRSEGNVLILLFVMYCGMGPDGPTRAHIVFGLRHIYYKEAKCWNKRSKGGGGGVRKGRRMGQVP